MFRRYSRCMTVITSGPQITFNWPICMGSASILFVLSVIEFYCCLTASAVRDVVVRHRVLGLRLVSATPAPVLRDLLALPRVCSVVASVAWVPRP